MKFDSSSPRLWWWSKNKLIDIIPHSLLKNESQSYSGVMLLIMGQGNQSTINKTKLLPDCDSCGRELCCRTFLKRPIEVNPEVLKQQSGKNRNKAIGVCGKIKCCLGFES